MADLNAYQQSKLNDLNAMKALSPEQYAQSNGTGGSWFDPTNYKSMQDWMNSDLLYQAYSGEYGSEGTDASKRQLDNRIQQLSTIWNSNDAKSGLLKDNYNEALRQMQQSYDYSLQHPTSDDSFMDNVMGKVFPAVVGAFMTGGAIAAMGDTAAGASAASASAGAGSAAADVPWSALPVDTASLGDTSWMSGIAGGATDTAAGLGTAATTGIAGVDSSIPQVVIHGGQGGVASIGSGLGTAGELVGAGALGSLPFDYGSVSGMPDISGVSVPQDSLPPLLLPTSTPTPDIPNSDITPSEGTSLGGLPGIPTGGGLPSGGGGLPSTGGGTPSLGNIIGGVGTILGGIADYKMNDADKQYYQGIVDKLNGMYNPGTPEANLMQSQMDAKDAAAGRNSQYGVRAMNLAGMLNQQRSNIMTSPGYVALAQDARGHYDNSLNGIFSAMGQASQTGSNLNNLVNSIPNITNTITNGGSYLSKIFGGGS